MKVSALVSAYFAEEYLHGRIANLLGQTPEPEVVVICQEGSKEHEIALQYKALVLTTSHIPTIGEAWNFGIIHAMGDYIVIANSDDRFFEGGIKALSDVLDNNADVGYVFSDQHLTIKGITERRFDHGRIGRGGKVENIKGLLAERYFCGSCPMWRRSLHVHYGYFNEGYIVASDYEWALRLANGGVNFYYLPESVGLYPIRDNSLEHHNQELCRVESREIRNAL
ncbi:MAG: Glycosyl transferase family 2 [Bacteroidetes bacterium ADurb.BinA104]|nr:MAG: Glycosyl transferase family 2 [Bacteroidetes bacterium ADurb.BinA104]